LCIAFTEELSGDVPLCQCVVETTYLLQDIGEQIEHKVRMFRLDSRPHATLGLQSGADVKSCAALLIYGANSVSTCACENHRSAKVQDRQKEEEESFHLKSFCTCVMRLSQPRLIIPLLKLSYNYAVTAISEWCSANHMKKICSFG